MTINSDGHGDQRSKDRITVTLIVSASGEKLIPQVIGKSKQPCVLRGIDIDKKYQVKYDFKSKAWQDGSSMLWLFHRIAGVAQSRKSKFYLLLDNCSSHVWAAKILHPEGSQETYFEIANLVIVFFPPNATSNCQPLDQGIIWTLKSQFWKAQLYTLLSEYEIWQAGQGESPTTKFPLNDHTHVHNTLMWLQEAYSNIPEDVIQHCFVKANCLPLVTNTLLNQNIQHISSASRKAGPCLNDLACILEKVHLHDDISADLGLDGINVADICSDLINFDKDEPTGSSEADEVEIMGNILQQSGNLQVDDDDDDVVNIEYVSTASAAQAICNICNFLGMCSTDSASGVYKQKSYILENLEELLKCFLKDQMVEKLEKLKQTSILSFFF